MSCIYNLIYIQVANKGITKTETTILLDFIIIIDVLIQYVDYKMFQLVKVELIITLYTTSL